MEDLNAYLYGLNYNNEDILTYNGENITNKFPTTGKNEGNYFVVVEKIKRNISNKNSDIAVMSSNEHVVFPGAILKANQGLLENNPTLISAKRGNLRISIDLPGMPTPENVEDVTNPTNSNIKGAINTLIERWNSKYSKFYPNVPTKIEYHETMVKSMDQLKVEFGLGFEKIGVPLNIDFNALTSGKKQIYVIHFKQIYYNVSIDVPSTPAEFFAPDVTKSDLVNVGVNEKTPPVYISNVSYGRSMYIKLETSSQSDEVQVAFQSIIKGADVKANAEFQSVLDSTTFTAVILGGDSTQAIKVISGDMKQLKEIIEQGSRYNRENPGVPVSYRTAFLKDNSPAVINSNTDYIETKITRFENGELVLYHGGWYVAKFYVTWNEVTYDESGNEILTPKNWEGNGRSQTRSFSVTIPFNGNVRNLNVKVMESTGLAWEPWRTIYDKKDMKLVKKRTISIWGTTLEPYFNEEIKND